jgi:hypothetical protein
MSHTGRTYISRRAKNVYGLFLDPTWSIAVGARRADQIANMDDIISQLKVIDSAQHLHLVTRYAGRHVFRPKDTPRLNGPNGEKIVICPRRPVR